MFKFLAFVMARLFCISLFFVTFLFHKSVALNPSCRQNEIFTTCGSCEATCDNLNPICTRMCRPPGCYCPLGFVRNTNNDCVAAITCATSKKKRQIEGENPCASTTCPIGKICVPKQVQCIRAPCPPIPECILLETRVKRDVSSSEPTPTCDPNEIYMTCGSCENQCDQPILFCTLQCRPAGCYCPHGFSRTTNGACVPDEQCPTTTDATPTVESNPCNLIDCPANQHCVPLPVQCLRQPCPVSGHCVPTTLNSRIIRSIPTANPSQCGMNEVYETCGYCEGTCADRHPECSSDKCEQPGCYCPRGFVRDRVGRCIHETVCDPTW